MNIEAVGAAWTNENPTKPGPYWWKETPDGPPIFIWVSAEMIAEGRGLFPQNRWLGPIKYPPYLVKRSGLTKNVNYGTVETALTTIHNLHTIILYSKDNDVFASCEHTIAVLQEKIVSPMIEYRKLLNEMPDGK